MEGRDGMSSGVTVVGSDAPSEYQLAPRKENPSHVSGSTAAAGGLASQVGSIPPPVAVGGVVSTMGKKKRGRPRKYGPDGSVAKALSPKPISSSAPPPVIDFSAEKRPKIRPVGSTHKLDQPKMDLANPGDWVSCSVGANFTPHIITVNAGEDVTMKVISFSQQGPRAICILSANGVISSVTLRQPDSSGGTLTYEGRFEILSLSGSFMLSENGGIKNRSGGMSVSLASPDGRVVGGGVAGLLIAAGPVQIIVGSFLTGNQHEPKVKKQKAESIINATPKSAIPVYSAEMEESYGGGGGGGGGHSSSTQKTTYGENWSSLNNNNNNNNNNKPTDINVTAPA